MAKVEWSAGIDTVSGALAKPAKNGQHSCNKMLMGTHRVAPTASSDCNRLYMRKKVKRSTTPSSDELAVRAAFSAISRAVNTRLHDQSKAQQDAAAFKAQTTYKTLRQYVWSICSQEYYDSLG